MSDEFQSYDFSAEDDLEDAPPDTEAEIGAFPNPDLSLCPVAPLGFFDGRVVFAMPEGEIRDEPAAKIGSMLTTDIFACQAGRSFLTSWRDRKDRFQRELAAVWFVRRCREAGYWDSGRPIRSLGVWPGEGGAVLLHGGDEVWAFREDAEPERRAVFEALREARGGPIYRLRPPAPKPGKPASTKHGGWIRETLDLWRFEAIGTEGLSGADVVVGWIGGALLGAVAPFRGHVVLSALAGSGKSSLIEEIHALLCSLTGEIVDSFSDAGLRGELSNMARPLLLDEAEAAPEGMGGLGAVEKALETLRRMSTGSGAHRKQGSREGGSVTQTAVGAVFLAAINPPKLSPADASRIVELRLLPLTGEVASREALDEAKAKAKRLSPHLLGRALSQAGRYLADVGTIKRAMGRAGESPRSADLVAMLAAGRRLLLEDKPLDDAAADREVAFWRPLMAQRDVVEAVTNPGRDALAHLMNADSGRHKDGRQLKVSELISNAVKWQEEAEALKGLGLRVERLQDVAGGFGWWLCVSNKHPALQRIFERTAWPDYRRTLGFLDHLGAAYATRAGGKRRFGVGVETRCLEIPLTPWLDEAERGVPDVPPGVPVQVDDW